MPLPFVIRTYVDMTTQHVQYDLLTHVVSGIHVLELGLSVGTYDWAQRSGIAMGFPQLALLITVLHIFYCNGHERVLCSLSGCVYVRSEGVPPTELCICTLLLWSSHLFKSLTTG